MLKILAVFILFGLCSCGASATRYQLLYNSPDGPPLFKKGWKDGCKTGKGAMQNSFYKQFYTDLVKDYKIKESDYGTGWLFGHWFCHRYYETQSEYQGML